MRSYPSRQDNLPNTCGLPEIVAGRVTGALAEPFEPVSLGAAIRWVLEDMQLSRALGAAAWERAERLWAPVRVAGLYAEVLRKDLAYDARIYMLVQAETIKYY